MLQKQSRLWALMSLLIVAALVLAACGGGQAPANTQSAPAAEEAAPAAEEAAEEAAPAGEDAEGVYQVGTNAEYAPFEFVDESGDVAGFDIDLLNAIAASQGIEFEFVNTRWDGIFVALANGEFDAVASAVTITDERKEVVDFSDSYFNAGQAIAVRDDNDSITGVESLTEGVTVGVQLGTTADIFATDNLPVTVQRYEDLPLALQALSNGDIEVVAADAPTLAAYIAENAELGLKMVGEPFTEELFGIAVNKEQPELLATINAGLEAIRADGTYDVIYEKWFGEAPVVAEGAAAGAAAAGEGATFVFGRGGDTVQLDSAVVTDGESFRVLNQGCESLLAYEADTTNTIASLAESWEANEDSTEWTFTLRQGVKFQDGTDFNADAVIFNFERWWDEANPYHFEEQVFEYWVNMFGGFKGTEESLVTAIEKVDDYTVKFTFKEPLAPVLANMAMPMFAIHSPAAVEANGVNYGTPEVGYVCTGPYQFEEWITGDRITLSRFADYWGEVPGNVETIVIRTIPDNSARFLALQAGEIHAMEQANIEDLATAEASEDVFVEARPALNTGYLAFNYSIQEFQDVRVREAIARAIDKQAIVDAFYGGYGEVATQFVPPLVWGHNPDLTGLPYDPDRAVELLAEAGFPDGLSEITLEDGTKAPLKLYWMPVVRPYYPNPEQIGQAMAAQLAAVGIDVDLEAVGDWAVYLDMRAAGELVGLYQLGWIGDNGDPDNFLGYFFANAAEPKAEEGFFQNAELAELLLQARSVPDQAERDTMYQQAGQILEETAGRVWIAHNRTPLILRNEVSGYVVNPLGTELYKTVTVE